MPKSKKPKGGRPAANFDPRYGAKKGTTPGAKRAGAPGSAGGAKPGSKSPKHRGYRPETPEERVEGKRRWSAQEKAGRDESRGIRGHARGRDEYRSRGTDAGRGGSSRGGAGYREDRPRRSGDDRPRRYSEDGPRRYSDQRPGRQSEGRSDRYGQGRSDRYGSDRPRRDDDRTRRPNDDRGARRFSEDRSDRPRRYSDDGPRREDRPRRDDAPRRDTRPYRDERPSRDDRARRDDARPHREERARRAPAPTRADWRPSAPASDDRADVVHERLQAQAVQADEVADVGFADLGLGQNLVKRLDEMGAHTPFPIQAATIPSIIDGADVLARGRTGSGKTIAFGAPLVETILRSQAGQKREYGRAPKALILAPTRELALQIDTTVQGLARSVGLFTTQIYGGVPQARQVGALKKGVDIVIGTPGRIEDLQAQGKLDLSQVRVAVLDEADHMCELGFLEPVQRILRLTADGSQKLLFSATLDREVAALVDEFLVDPAVYEVAGEDQDSGTIDHRVLVIDHRKKTDILASLVDRDGKTLVFARTRAYAEMLAEQFGEVGVSAVALHGDLNQARRTRNLKRLTDGKAQVLVATDVAARGIHVDDIDLVIQADAPDEYKTYLHRSGRTGRAGREGTVVTLVTRQRRRRMTELLDRAEIDAPFVDAQPGDDILEELAGRQVDPVA